MYGRLIGSLARCVGVFSECLHCVPRKWNFCPSREIDLRDKVVCFSKRGACRSPKCRKGAPAKKTELPGGYSVSKEPLKFLENYRVCKVPLKFQLMGGLHAI